MTAVISGSTAPYWFLFLGAPSVKLSPSAHADTFCRDNLPPADQWPTLRFDLPELQYPERVNCATALLDEVAAAHWPDRPCLLTAGDSWTYAELLTRANQIAHVLTEDFGLVPGQRVLLRGPNNPWLVASWFGVLKAGGVAVTTMPMLRSLELGPLTELTSPAVAICDHRFTEELASAAPGLPLVPYGGTSDGDLIERSAAKPGTFADVATAADDVAMLAATSGTTGTPKATMHFHRDVLAIADTFGKYLVQSQPTDVFDRDAPAGLHLRSGRAAGLPDAGRGGHAAGGEGHPGRAGRCRRALRGDRGIHLADRLPGHAEGGQGRLPARAAHRRVGR